MRGETLRSGCLSLQLLLMPLLLRPAEAAYYSSYRTYYYTTSYVPIGAIIGSVIGAISFFAFVITVLVCVCCVRRRRLMTARGPAAAGTVPGQMPPIVGTPIAIVSGEAVNYPKQNGPPNGYAGTSFPPPYPAAAALGPHSNGCQPEQGAFYSGQQPYPQQQQQQQQLPYPPPAYQYGAQAEQRF